MKTIALALVAIGCSVAEEPCREPDSVDLNVIHRESDCIPDLDVRQGVLHCEQTAGNMDDVACEFRGQAACSGGVTATVWFSLEPGEPAHGHATYRRPEDGCTVELELSEPR